MPRKKNQFVDTLPAIALMFKIIDGVELYQLVQKHEKPCGLF